MYLRNRKRDTIIQNDHRETTEMVWAREVKGRGEYINAPADCVGPSSVNMYKNKIDMYLRRAGYI